ncbi:MULTISPECIES: FecR family protein [Niastella]|uniref:FecR family protein n=1 Tax=Niastella soli TaxID=2821487 RepID=A0ABS3Z303_9BACT|nr:FecR family protein [Niastella soli]MBO9204542.1 FecR family protein [Niastella soli]
MSQSNFDRLLQKYLAGQCTEEEEKLVLEWYEQMVHNSDLHLSDGERSLIEARMWQAIQTNLQLTAADAAPTKIRQLTARTWFQLSAAAVVTGLIATAVLLYWYQPARNQSLVAIASKENYDSLVNETNIDRRVQLTDSTLITLQPGARLYYPLVFTGTTREVFLKGSAFFNVYHNPAKHFKVHLNNGLTTEVLGTSFHITQHTDQNTEVAVVTGKVLVYRQQVPKEKHGQENAAGILLTRNKKVTYNAVSNLLITGIVDDPKPLAKTARQQGPSNQTSVPSFVFEEALLQDVLQSLSDAYGILIKPETEQLGHRHFHGDISKYSLFSQLEYICKTTQTSYEINGSQIIIKETRTGNP